MIYLIDTFNRITISRHRTILAAVKAARAHDRAVKRANGRDSYIPTTFENSDGSPIDWDEVDECKLRLDRF